MGVGIGIGNGGGVLLLTAVLSVNACGIKTDILWYTTGGRGGGGGTLCLACLVY